MDAESNILATWVEQLRECLSEARSGADCAFEVASLAGLISRSAPHEAAVLEARAWTSGEGRDALLRSLPVDVVEEEADALACLDDDIESEVRHDRVFAFDELCAGLHFATASGPIREAIRDLLVPSIRAFPTHWRDLVPAATRTLAATQRDCPDPALDMWRAIEATALLAPAEDVPPTRLDTYRKLGLAVPEISSRPQQADARLSAASASFDLPDPVDFIDEEDLKAEISIATDGGPPRLVLEGARSSRARLVGPSGNITLLPSVTGDLECVLSPGEYVLHVDGESWPLIVKD